MPLASSCVTPSGLYPAPAYCCRTRRSSAPALHRSAGEDAQENDQPAATSIAFVIPATVTGTALLLSFRRELASTVVPQHLMLHR